MSIRLCLIIFHAYQNADLTNANLEGANLEGANLKVITQFQAIY